MEEQNWGSSEKGAQIVEVSEARSLATSSAANLLNPREDHLWIAGSVPQYVVLKLNPAHPPLRYAGWHVWHDYPTNPSKVEIASGESADALSPLLICRALPGAGTQLWLLPKPIPPHHLYVRLKITDSFTAGPTYMSTVVLLENDPGPTYRGGALPVADAAAANELHPDLGAAGTSKRALDMLPKILVRHGRAEQFLHHGATPNTASTEQSYVLLNAGSTTSREPISGTVRSTSAPIPDKSRNRLGKLLKDLEEDIRNLHPIKGIHPPPSMFLPALQDTSLLSPPTTDTGNSTSTDGKTHRASLPRPQKHPPLSPPYPYDAPAVDWEGPHGEVEALPPHVLAMVTKLGDRIGILEQAVASLTQTVQHQREDLTMMKRLQRQQAIERRKESEWRHEARREEEQRHAGALLALNSTDHKLNHHQIDVNFPEEALRGYVESIMEERLQKKLKKNESKTLKRLDVYLKDVIRSIAESVDVQLNHILQ
ncbi:unnamed protein product [Phytomonas sp. Hart1]|nr:unnamed protein product [Phytomonas sp. Hart1]|eukprot:CCW71054.1 unnamed protein product [Phytomonas sp. isolate Hart1]